MPCQFPLPTNPGACTKGYLSVCVRATLKSWEWPGDEARYDDPGISHVFQDTTY